MLMDMFISFFLGQSKFGTITVATPLSATMDMFIWGCRALQLTQNKWPSILCEPAFADVKLCFTGESVG
jgi:hypothetical protein